MSSMFHFFLLFSPSLPPSEPLEQARCLKGSGSELIKRNSWGKSSKLRLTAKGKTRAEKIKKKKLCEFLYNARFTRLETPLNSLVLVAGFFSLIIYIKKIFIVRSSCRVSSGIYSVWVFVYCRCYGLKHNRPVFHPSFQPERHPRLCDTKFFTLWLKDKIQNLLESFFSYYRFLFFLPIR